MNDTILSIIFAALADLNDELDEPALEHPTPQTRLFGNGGALDSLSLVSLIADVEEKVFEAFGKTVLLADDKAMSQRVSPFRDVETLAAYIEKLLNG